MWPRMGALNLVSVADQSGGRAPSLPWSISGFMRLELAQLQESFDDRGTRHDFNLSRLIFVPLLDKVNQLTEGQIFPKHPHVALLRDTLIEILDSNKWRLPRAPNIQSSILSYVDHFLTTKIFRTLTMVYQANQSRDHDHSSRHGPAPQVLNR